MRMRAARLAVPAIALLCAAAPLIAQTVPMLRGTVRDSTGRALPDVIVSYKTTKTTSDSVGRFLLVPVPLGRITVRFERDGLLLGEIEANVTSDTTPSVVVEAIPNPTERRSLLGTVVDSSGAPVRDATIEVVTALLEQRSDSLGRFAFRNLPPRRHIVRVRRVGYSPTFLFADLTDSTATRARIVVRQFAGQNLGLVVVRATRMPVRMRGFLQRAERRSGWGRIMTEKEILERHPLQTTDLLRMIPGVRVNFDSRRSSMVTGRGGCLMGVFINGFPAPQLSGMGIDDMVNTLDLAGIEVYNGIGGVPAELTMGPSNPCGTIGIWTR
ncbi:MAG: TonB-dependent receptor [Gemmatimonadaceae bacterium]|nr:TonB-dependent receptor [Gemmatimonadaceae bacterium]